MLPLLTTVVLSSLLILPPFPAPSDGDEAPPPSGTSEEATVAVTGSTRARNQVLRRGCRTYSYKYAVSAPYDDWTLETRILDRTGRSVAAGTLIGPNDAMT